MPTKETLKERMAEYKKLMNRRVMAVSQIVNILGGFDYDSQEVICRTVIGMFNLDVDVDC